METQYSPRLTIPLLWQKRKKTLTGTRSKSDVSLFFSVRSSKSCNTCCEEEMSAFNDQAVINRSKLFFTCFKYVFSFFWRNASIVYEHMQFAKMLFNLFNYFFPGATWLNETSPWQMTAKHQLLHYAIPAKRQQTVWLLLWTPFTARSKPFLCKMFLHIFKANSPASHP